MGSRPQLTVLVGNLSSPSRTVILAQALVDAVTRQVPMRVTLLQAAQLAPHLSLDGRDARPGPQLQQALTAIATADLLIAATPVYKGSYTGLFKHVFDLVPPDALVGKPVLLAATGGSERHALVVDHQLRPLFSFFRALTVPSAVYASDADFQGQAVSSAALRQRVEEAASQAAALLRLRSHAAAVELVALP